MDKEKEYERISTEILQDQRIRITIFTFSIASMAGLIGLSEKLSDSSTTNPDAVLLILIISLYVILIPSVILVYNFTRGVNLKSEYLKIFHKEKWMSDFDELMQDVMPNSTSIRRDYTFLHRIKAYSTENTLILTYNLLNIIILLFGMLKLSGDNNLFYYLYGGLFVVTSILIYLVKPISKSDYFKLWCEVKEKQETQEEEQNDN